MPDALVTGGTGFVGGAVVARLAEEGMAVRALARDPSAEASLRQRGAADVVTGDVLDQESLERAMAGCPLVFHVAGVNETCLADPAPMYRVNIDGSVNVVRAAASAGVGRIVYTSSLAAVGERAGETATEATPHSGEYLTHYSRSKHHAEMAVLAEGARAGVEVVALSPASVQGPGRTGGTARILMGYLSGRLRFAVDTVLSVVSVADTAEAHLLAAGRGAPGERYLVSGATLSVRETVALLERVTGTSRRVRYLPAWAVVAAASAVGAGFRLVGRRPPLCREVARVLCHGARCDGSRAERELGLRYTPVEQWMAEAVAWYRERGLV